VINTQRERRDAALIEQWSKP